MSVAATLAEARRLIAAGEREAAFALLRRAIHESPREPALWYLLAQATEVRAQRVEALRRTLTLDPSHAGARAELEALGGKASAPPAPLLQPTPPAPAPRAAPEEPPTLWPDRRSGATPGPAAKKGSTVAMTAPFPLETQPGAPFPPLPTEPPPPRTQPLPRRWYGVGGAVALLGMIVLCGWLGARNASAFLPGPLARRAPAAATALMRVELLSGPAPTALPEPDWVAAARAARMVNDFARAQTLLSEGLSQGSDELATEVALAELYNDWPPRAAEAEGIALAALQASPTFPERARALEPFLVARLARGDSDLSGVAEAVAQVSERVPNSPYAQWASAAVAAIRGDAAACHAAASLALHLDRRADGTPAARYGAILARLGDREGAIAQYGAALAVTDYAPWHAALAQLHLDAGNGEAARPHLDSLRERMPEHPLVAEP